MGLRQNILYAGKRALITLLAFSITSANADLMVPNGGGSGGGSSGPVVNIAAICNGTFDNQPIIQPILTALGAANGGTALLPAGPCNINTPMYMPSNVCLKGVGAGATYLQSTTSALLGNAASKSWFAQNQTTYPINTPVQGSTTFTTTNPGDAVNFPANQSVLIAGQIYEPYTAPVTPGHYGVGFYYTISVVGNTDFTLIGASSNTVGVNFKATNTGSSQSATTGSAWFNTDFWFPAWLGKVLSEDSSTGIVTLTEALPIGGYEYVLAVPTPTPDSNICVSDMTLQSTVSAETSFELINNLTLNNVQCGLLSDLSACIEIGVGRGNTVNNLLNPPGAPYQEILEYSCYQCTISHSKLNEGSFGFEAGTTDSVMLDDIIIGPNSPSNLASYFEITAGAYRNRLTSISVVNLPDATNAIALGSYAGTNNSNNEGSNIIDGCLVISAGAQNTGSGISIGASNNNQIGGCTFIGTALGVSTYGNSLGTGYGINIGENNKTGLYQEQTPGSTMTGPYATLIGSGLNSGSFCNSFTGTAAPNAICLGDGLAETISATGSAYNATTGLVTVALPYPIALSPGVSVTVSGLTGTGNFADLNGTYTTVAGTGVSTVVYQTGTIKPTSSNYNSGTGLVTLFLSSSAALTLSSGASITVSGVTGTGTDLASVNGAATTGSGTTGSTITFTIATGLNITSITGGLVTVGATTITGGTLSAGGLFYNPLGSQDLGIGAQPAAGVRLDVQGGSVRIGPGAIAGSGGLSVTGVGGTSGAIIFGASTSNSFGWNGTVFTLAGGGLTISTGNLTVTTGQIISSNTVTGNNFVAIAAAPTVAAGKVGYGGTTTATGTCPTGTVGGQTVVGCIIENVGGTNHNVPYF